MTDNDDGVINLELVRGRLADGALTAVPAPGGKEPPPAPRRDGLRDDCPVAALGLNDGRFYFLDAMRQLREIPASRFDGKHISALFAGKTRKLMEIWPRCDKNGKALGWQSREAMESLMDACARVGVWDPWEKVRGPGAWRGDGGELILHVGDRVLSFAAAAEPYGDKIERAPGVTGSKVYPAAPRGPAPALDNPGTGEGSPGQVLYDQLLSWPWRRGAIAATLALGWLGAAMIGGALHWRPAVWITGGRGSGKSTLQRVLDRVLDGGAISVSDATAAGIWQALGHSSLPIKFDELESDDDNRRAIQILHLMRQATSGGLILRGSADHGARAFKANGAFLASSILMPPMRPADHSRIAVLDLGDLEKGAAAPSEDAGHWRQVGAGLRRRLVDGWGKWDGIVDRYRARLTEIGHDARGCDLYGTLLASAHVMLSDGEEIYESWCALLEPAVVTMDGDRDETNMIQHLLQTRIVPFAGGQKYTLAQWVRRAAGFDTEWSNAAAVNSSAKANKVLGLYGLKVEWIADPRPGVQVAPWLAIANKHQGLGEIFDKTQWGTRPGAAPVWVQAARRLPGATWANKTFWFCGCGAKATLLPAGSVVAAIEVEG